jgi:hypothetical protein
VIDETPNLDKKCYNVLPDTNCSSSRGAVIDETPNLDNKSDNVLPDTNCSNSRGAVIDDYGAMMECLLAGENRRNYIVDRTA